MTVLPKAAKAAIVAAAAPKPRRKYVAVGSNRDLMEATGTETLVSGPAGTGKTRACLERIHRDLRRYPRSRALIVRKTRVSLSESVLNTYETQVLAPNSPIKVGPERRHRAFYQYPNGSRLILGGLDNPTRLFSSEYDLIYVPEAIEVTENEWESLLRALRNGRMPTQQLIGDTNPGASTHWLKKRSDAGRTRRIDANHRDNPAYVDPVTGKLTPRGVRYFAVLEQLTGVRRLRLLLGIWAAAEGLVYDTFDPSVHLVDPFPIPPDWRRFRVIDFGYTNPFVCQWWALDPDARMYLYRELYGTRRLVSDWAKEIKRLTGEESIENTLADHDAEGRATLEDAGIWTNPADKAIEPGIEAVEERLRKAGDGKPRLFLFRGATVERDELLAEKNLPCSTEEEFSVYCRPEAKEGKAVKEVPVKLHDHGMDAMRYGVRHADQPAFGIIGL